jgi:hypothetical protein
VAEFYPLVGPVITSCYPLTSALTLSKRFANPRWVCEQCTLLNSPAEAQCNACEGARPPTQPQWSCVNCTFSNPDNALVCVVCARSRLQLAAGDNKEAKVAGDGKSASILSPTSDAKSGEETKETGKDSHANHANHRYHHRRL